MVLNFLETKRSLVEFVLQRETRNSFEGNVYVEDPLNDDRELQVVD